MVEGEVGEGHKSIVGCGGRGGRKVEFLDFLAAEAEHAWGTSRSGRSVGKTITASKFRRHLKVNFAR